MEDIIQYAKSYLLNTNSSDASAQQLRRSVLQADVKSLFEDELASDHVQALVSLLQQLFNSSAS